MVLGEYDFEDNFLFDHVKANNDDYISVQVTRLLLLLHLFTVF
jgi:hypothetical protein